MLDVNHWQRIAFLIGGLLLPKQNDKLTFTFVTGGLKSAIAKAKAAAADKTSRWLEVQKRSLSLSKGTRIAQNPLASLAYSARLSQLLALFEDSPLHRPSILVYPPGPYT